MNPGPDPGLSSKLVLLLVHNWNNTHIRDVFNSGMPARKFQKEGKETLPSRSYIIREVEADTRKKELEVEEQESRLVGKIQMTSRQERLFAILVYAFPVSVIFTLMLVVLDGYSMGGFDVDTSTVNRLIAATIAEIAGLLTIIITSRPKINGY